MFFCNPFRLQALDDGDENAYFNNCSFEPPMMEPSIVEEIPMQPISHLHGDHHDKIKDELSLAYTYDGDEEDALVDYHRKRISDDLNRIPHVNFYRSMSGISACTDEDGDNDDADKDEEKIVPYNKKDNDDDNDLDFWMIGCGTCDVPQDELSSLSSDSDIVSEKEDTQMQSAMSNKMIIANLKESLELANSLSHSWVYDQIFVTNVR
uniref:Uncharacterized protein n=1 Tax=Grammatophora oceanica TaxID=210454 RepID=A0A7S1Y410_9STRA|mmetsp:Transcript_17525/g.25970  ORF Transcript_17525/g.25970 Transcript_17525/m.25970 type:complete len:208 (+) Transcript_17525:82-705(+)